MQANCGQENKRGGVRTHACFPDSTPASGAIPDAPELNEPSELTTLVLAVRHAIGSIHVSKRGERSHVNSDCICLVLCDGTGRVVGG